MVMKRTIYLQEFLFVSNDLYNTLPKSGHYIVGHCTVNAIDKTSINKPINKHDNTERSD